MPQALRLIFKDGERAVYKDAQGNNILYNTTAEAEAAGKKLFSEGKLRRFKVIFRKGSVARTKITIQESLAREKAHKTRLETVTKLAMPTHSKEDIKAAYDQVEAYRKNYSIAKQYSLFKDIIFNTMLLTIRYNGELLPYIVLSTKRETRKGDILYEHIKVPLQDIFIKKHRK